MFGTADPGMPTPPSKVPESATTNGTITACIACGIPCSPLPWWLG